MMSPRRLSPVVLTALAVALSLPLLPRTSGELLAATVGRTLVVDPAGSDTTGDGSAAKPWKTIQKAASQVQPGDLVQIDAGTYSGPITIDRGGTAAAPITFRANAAVVVEGSGSSRDAVTITYADYVTVDGWRVQHATRAGLRVDNSNHVTVKNGVYADNGTWGIFTDFSDDVVIEGNEA